MKQQIRIIGGTYRGKKISFPDMPDLRPTTDRIRETLFNWLMHDIRQAVCLDAFAGSGALGFEAISRGAQHVCFIESSAKIYQHLKKEASAFNHASIEIIHAQTNVFLKNFAPNTFDIIFYDPPFSSASLYGTPLQEECQRILKPNGLLYVEANQVIDLAPKYFEKIKNKHSGDVYYSLYLKK